MEATQYRNLQPPGGFPKIVRRLFAITLLLAVVPSSADAASRFVIRGGGFGHGVGMSQYGALGQAQAGRGYQQILRHYYSDTAVGRLESSPSVRVLLQSNRGTVSFTGAVAAGDRVLQPDATYRAKPSGGNVNLYSSSGRRLKTFAGPLRAVPPAGGAFRLVGGSWSGTYRGALELRPSLFGGMNAINAVDLEDYVRGVVSAESPSSWPAEALKAQAVAARSYAITTSKGGSGWDHYPDTRSQMYRGVSAETGPTNAAVNATAREVVTYDGKPIVTYFFSTSGGRTENVEFGFPGGKPHPALKSVADPWDKVSPRHRWGPITMSRARAQRKLGSWVKGTFRGIKVTRRGVSPRIVSAEVVGSRGRTTVSGPALRTRFGLYDTWIYFALIESNGRRSDPGNGNADDIGRAASLAARSRFRGSIHGTIGTVREGTGVKVQKQVGARRWRTVGQTRVGSGGRYRMTVERRGTYRVVVSGLAGPAVKIR